MKEQAIKSGLVVSLDSFITAVLSHDVEASFFTDKELAQALREVVEDIPSRGSEQVPVTHITLGQYHIDRFFASLRYQFMDRCDNSLEAHWKSILKLITPRGEDHPTIAGTER